MSNCEHSIVMARDLPEPLETKGGLGEECAEHLAASPHIDIHESAS